MLYLDLDWHEYPFGEEASLSSLKDECETNGFLLTDVDALSSHEP